MESKPFRAFPEEEEMHVGIYIYDQAEVLDFSGPFEVFATASRVCPTSDPFHVFLVGEPYTVKTGLVGHPGGCVERWTFEYAKARGFGNVTYSEILIVDFDPDGKVCDHAYSQTGSP